MSDKIKKALSREEANKFMVWLQDEVGRLEQREAAAKREAESLAMALWSKHYKDVSPDFSLCDSVAGVISQIDNMVSGLVDIDNLDEITAIKSLVLNGNIQDTPVKTSWGGGMKVVNIAIGDDETAFVYLHEEAIKFLGE